MRGIADSFIEGAKEKSFGLSSVAVILDFFSRLVCPVSAESVAINRRSKTHDAVDSDDSHSCEET